MPNINDRDIEAKISQVEGQRWERSQIEQARKDEVSVIYGNSGVARYFVGEDGEVRYSRMHGTQPEKAQEAGFQLD